MAARSMTAPPEESGRASRFTSANLASSFILHTVLFAKSGLAEEVQSTGDVRL